MRKPSKQIAEVIVSLNSLCLFSHSTTSKQGFNKSISQNVMGGPILIGYPELCHSYILQHGAWYNAFPADRDSNSCLRFVRRRRQPLDHHHLDSTVCSWCTLISHTLSLTSSICDFSLHLWNTLSAFPQLSINLIRSLSSSRGHQCMLSSLSQSVASFQMGLSCWPIRADYAKFFYDVTLGSSRKFFITRGNYLSTLCLFQHGTRIIH